MWESKYVGIIVIKTGTQIHFLSDVLVAVASLDLEVPNTDSRANHTLAEEFLQFLKTEQDCSQRQGTRAFSTKHFGKENASLAFFGHPENGVDKVMMLEKLTG